MIGRSEVRTIGSVVWIVIRSKIPPEVALACVIAQRSVPGSEVSAVDVTTNEVGGRTIAPNS